MRAKELILTVLKDGVDYTKQAFDFSKKNFSLSIATGEYLYIGYSKRINNIFFELATANTSNSNLIVEAFNGTTWEEVDTFDKTDGFENSGFVMMNENYTNTETEVEGITQTFLRFSVDVSTSSMTFRGINCIFCDEDDLILEEPNVKEYYPEQMDSHILSMAAARHYIVQRMRNEGHIKHSSTSSVFSPFYGDIKNITQFDFFDIEDVKMMAVYYSLYKIFFNISDSSEDQYYIKAEDYLEKFESVYKVFILKLDVDDDGEEDEGEKNRTTNKFHFTK